jgi:hypothetical protein
MMQDLNLATPLGNWTPHPDIHTHTYISIWHNERSTVKLWGRNPQTGEPIMLAPRKVVKFRRVCPERSY